MIIKNWSDLSLIMKILIVFLFGMGVSFLVWVFVSQPCEHNFKEWKIEKAATCNEYGMEVSNCNKCNEQCKKRIDKIGHLTSEWIIDKEASCIEDGKKHKECSLCKEVLAEGLVESYGGHELFISKLDNEGIVGSALVYTCDRCGTEEEKVVKELSVSLELVSEEKKFENGLAYYKETYVAKANGGCGKYQFRFDLLDQDTEKLVEGYTQAFSNNDTYDYVTNDLNKLTKTYSIVVTVKDAFGNQNSYVYNLE